MAEMNPHNRKTHGKSGLRAKRLSTRVDLTAMVDLGFLLITFFMVGTVMNKPKQIEVNMPERPRATERNSVACCLGGCESRRLSILLGENDKVYAYSATEYGTKVLWVDSTNFSKEGIRATILKKQADVAGQWGNKDELIIFIKSMPNACYKNLVDILDEMAITSTKRYVIVETDYNDLAIMKAVGASQF